MSTNEQLLKKMIDALPEGDEKQKAVAMLLEQTSQGVDAIRCFEHFIKQYNDESPLDSLIFQALFKMLLSYYNKAAKELSNPYSGKQAVYLLLSVFISELDELKQSINEVENLNNDE